MCLCVHGSMPYLHACGVLSCPWVEELCGMCAHVSVGVCSVGRSVAGQAVCEFRSCVGCVLMCLWEYAVLAGLRRDELSVS